MSDRDTPGSAVLTARPATLADAALLLRWRNDPGTVAASRVQAPVIAHDHVAWLERTLADPTRRLRIVGNRVLDDGPPHLTPKGRRVWLDLNRGPDVDIATYRLDGVGAAQIEVSLTVAPEHRGRGLAREVVQLACREALTHGPEVLTAEIRRENIPSFVAFFRNGFVITGWRGGILVLEVEAEEVIRRACPLCLAHVEHHTNATGSIGGAEGRHPRYDLHVSEGGGLQECRAGDLWLSWEAGARERLRSAAGLSAGSTPAASTTATRSAGPADMPGG